MVKIISLTVAAIITAEALVMLFLASFGAGLSLPVRVLLDTTLLTICVFPTLYLLVFKEMAEQVRLRELAEKAQHDCNQGLELIIEERTERLQRTNQDLLSEVQERARAEMALRAALNEARNGKDQMLAIIDAMRDALVVVDSEWRVLSINRAAETMFRRGSYDLQGASLKEFLASWQQPAGSLDSLFDSGQSHDQLCLVSPYASPGETELIQVRYATQLLWDGAPSRVLMFYPRQNQFDTDKLNEQPG